MMQNRDDSITIENTMHALQVFLFYLDFNLAGLVKLTNDTVALCNGKTAPAGQVALGMAMGVITELAEKNFSFFCQEYANQTIKIDYGDHANEYMNNDIIQDNVSDTLSEVSNILAFGFRQLCPVIEGDSLSYQELPVAELLDLKATLETAKSAAFIACLSIVKHQEKTAKQSDKSAGQQGQKSKHNLH